MVSLSKKSQASKDKAMESAALRTGALFGITVNMTILYVLKDVKKSDCECDDKDWRHTFCSYYSMFLVAVNFMVLMLGSNKMLQQFAPGLHLLNLVNVMALVTYLHKLASEICNCEYSKLQTVFRYIYYFIAFFYIVAIINGVFYLFSLYTQKD